jgi:hypothetical protein
LTCPRKLALKTLGVKVREGKPSPRLPISNPVGLSAEKLTEEVLEIIASLQTDRSRGECVEVYEERGEGVKVAVQKIVEALDAAEGSHILDETLRAGAEHIVASTIDASFSRIRGLPALRSYIDSYREEMKEGFLNLLKSMLDKLPKIVAVYKPVLRNRDICSLACPDYQVETEKGGILLEVKNVADLSRAICEATDDILYYNSLLADRELGDSTWLGRQLPKPTTSLIVIPRHGVVKEVSERIPNFRDVAVEVWKIKRAALVEGVLPYVRRVSSVCGRCGYKRFCEKMRVEQLEPAKPLPLIYAIAEAEKFSELNRLHADYPPGFWRAYFELKKKAELGDEKAKEELRKMVEYYSRLHLKHQEEACKLLYNTMPDEFDSWGGLNFLKENFKKLKTTAHILYPPYEKNAKLILKVAMKRWEKS